MHVKPQCDSSSSLAIMGGQAIASGVRFPLDDATCSQAAAEAVLTTLKSGKWSLFTSRDIVDFEEEFADYIGARYAILFNSCTTALHASLLAHGVSSGGAVAMPAFTYIGTCMPALAIGASPVYVDLESRSQSLCAHDLARVIESVPLQAVIQAHLFGCCGYLERVHALCQEWKIGLIHDCAQLLGNRHVTERVCQSGVTCFSFGESKILRIGEGGAAATNSAELAEKLRLVRHEGELWLRSGQSRVSGWRPTAVDVLEHLASVAVGLNYRPVALLASLGRVKLRELDGHLALTRRNAEYLLRGLSGLEGLTLPTDAGRTWWTFPVLLDDFLDRNAFLAALLAEGIPVGVHFPRLTSEHPAAAARSHEGQGLCPNAVRFARQHIVLPIYPALSEDHMQSIIDGVKKVGAASERERHAYTGRARKILEEARLRELVGGLFLFVDGPVCECTSSS